MKNTYSLSTVEISALDLVTGIRCEEQKKMNCPRSGKKPICHGTCTITHYDGCDLCQLAI